MAQSLLESHPFGGDLGQQTGDEVFDLGGEVAWELKVDFQYFFVGLLSASFGLKRSMTRTQLIAQNANAPHINHLIILVSQHNLRRDIV
jgi:hypothetical protein